MALLPPLPLPLAESRWDNQAPPALQGTFTRAPCRLVSTRHAEGRSGIHRHNGPSDALGIRFG